MPPHVTVIFPFKPLSEINRGIEEKLSTLFASCKAFDFRLESLGRFPNVLYLKPLPAEPFVEMTKILVSEFPENLPYGGKFPEPIPHLTVASDEDQTLLASLEDNLRSQIDELSTHVNCAKSVSLFEKRSGGMWEKRTSFELGGK